MPEIVTPTSGSKRQRAQQACEPCRLRKRKCNGEDPCSQCRDFEYRCHYNTQKHMAAPSAKTRRVDVNSSATGSSPPALRPESSGRGVYGISPQPGLSDPVRAKYAPSESAVSFPRLLGGELAPERAPRLHCFAWNTGIRPEIPRPQIDITRLLTLSEAQYLSSIYFKTVHPEIGFLDEGIYKQKLELTYAGRVDPKDSSHLGMIGVILGVTLLGSFFLGADGHKMESSLDHALSEVLHILSGIYFPLVNHCAAWILRVLYLRLTTRPNASWQASTSMIHALELIGLDRDHGSAPFSNDLLLDEVEVEYRRRLCFVAYSLHSILSKEYGRKKIQLEVTTKFPKLDHTFSILVPFLSIAQCLEVNESHESHEDKIAVLISILDKICEVKTVTDFQQLLATDQIFATYRRLRVLQHKLSKPYEEIIVGHVISALAAAKRLADRRIPWWNVVSCPFQCVCVLLAIDSPESLGALTQAIATLEHLVTIWDTFMIGEALSVATNLVKLARDKKADDLRKIEASIQSQPDAVDLSGQGSGLEDFDFWNGWMNDSLGLDFWIPGTTNGVLNQDSVTVYR